MLLEVGKSHDATAAGGGVLPRRFAGPLRRAARAMSRSACGSPFQPPVGAQSRVRMSVCSGPSGSRTETLNPHGLGV